MKQRWRDLLRLLHADRPPRDMGLYVTPPRSSADEICEAFEADPTGFQKFLLVGARGGGKSTELRQVARRIGPDAALVTIDLDASGVSAAGVSAFDLLYVSGLALLRLVTEDDRKQLFGNLTTAYAGSDRPSLGSVTEALDGLVEFAGAAQAVATAVDVATQVPVISAGLSLAHKGLRLRGNGGLVSESSPKGRGLQVACTEIARAVRDANPGKPICVLLDGLEKMNGDANERFQNVFCNTRLLADTEWTAAIAAPPSTLTKTDSAHSVGYQISTVWGFDPEQPELLARLLRLRFEAAELNPDTHIEAEQFDRVSRLCSGLPRHAIRIMHATVQRALIDDAPRITEADIDGGIQKLAEELGRGLTADDFRDMESVHKTGRLPGSDNAAVLFANGRILAYPPKKGSPLTRFAVHPLLVGAVEPSANNA